MQLKFTEELMRDYVRNGIAGSYAIAVGVGDDEGRIFSPGVDGDTYFDIASLGKVLVTSPLILHAVGMGKLSLTDTLEDILPRVPDEKKKITIQQLLTHTSGIPRIHMTKNVARDGRDAVIDEILAAPLRFAPGTGVKYDCNCMVLLGFINELVYGMPLERAFEKYIKEPLGLTRSRFSIDFSEPNYVICNHDILPYSETEPGKGVMYDDGNNRTFGYPQGAGGFFFTLSDIVRYIRAVLARDERLYPGKIFELAERTYTDEGPVYTQVRGLGWCKLNPQANWAGGLFPLETFGHHGWTGQNFFITRANNMYTVVMTNYTRYSFKRQGCMKEDEQAAFFNKIHETIRADLQFQNII